MKLPETANLPTRMAPKAAAQDGSQEEGKGELLLKLLRVEPDTMDHLYRVTGWDRDVTRKTLLQLVADGKVKCTNRSNFRWFSVRDKWRAG